MKSSQRIHSCLNYCCNYDNKSTMMSISLNFDRKSFFFRNDNRLPRLDPSTVARQRNLLSSITKAQPGLTTQMGGEDRKDLQQWCLPCC